MWSGNRSVRSRRRASGLGWSLAVGVLVATACSGRSTVVPGGDEQAGSASPTGHSGGKGGSGGRAGTAGGAGLAAGKPGLAGTGGTGDVPFDDPGCPDAEAPAPIVECGVFDDVNACPDGLVCKPDIAHPYGAGCGQQVFNMRCVPPGPGVQGDPCDTGMSACAEGFICVVGASHGALCLRMCPLGGSTRCPSGYVCGPTDADGIGVCA